MPDLLSLPKDYRHTTPISVRFADLDAMGHLNNAKYLTYIEQARIFYVRDVCGWQGDWAGLGMILAKTTIDYLLPIGFSDAVVVYTRCSRIGTKSFDFAYLITCVYEGEITIAAQATSVMVAYDYATEQTISVPEDWRAKMTAYEPTLA